MEREEYFGLDVANLDRYMENRKVCISTKQSAVYTHFSELDGVINLSAFAKRFMQRSQSWFSQRINKCVVMNKEQTFKADDFKRISDGFRTLAQQLNQYADEIDRAEL